MDRKKIVETFDRIEAEAGGLLNSIPSMTLDKTAAELGIPREIVRETMIDHWTMRGSG